MRAAFLTHFVVFDMLVILMVYVSVEYFEMFQYGSSRANTVLSPTHICLGQRIVG